MPLPPAAPLFLIGVKRGPHLLHLFLFRILCEFHPHFEGADLLLTEQIHPDRQGGEGVWMDVRGVIDRESEQGIVCVAGRVEDVKSISHDLGHEEAGAMGRNVNDPAGKGSGNDLTVLLAHHMHVKGEEVSDSFRSTVFDIHMRQVFC